MFQNSILVGFCCSELNPFDGNFFSFIEKKKKRAIKWKEETQLTTARHLKIAALSANTTQTDQRSVETWLVVSLAVSFS